MATTTLKCSGCLNSLPEGCYSKNQKRKKENRKCKGCKALSSPVKADKNNKNKKQTPITLINRQYNLDIMIADWGHMFCNTIDEDFIWQRCKVVETLPATAQDPVQYRINTIKVSATSIDEIYEVITADPMVGILTEDLIGNCHSFYKRFQTHFKNKMPVIDQSANIIGNPINGIQPDLSTQIRNVINDPNFRRDFDNKPD
eukprot:554882_1